MDRFVDTLGRMRGAALKLGQMLSIQGRLSDGHRSGDRFFFRVNLSSEATDNAFLPPQLQTLLLRVQNNAHYMPESQLEVLVDRFHSVDDER